jgi:hypothetical protein
VKRPFRFVDDPTALAARPGEHLARVPAGLRDKAALLDALARVLVLPPYFGHNWDALDECLRDLHWLASPRVVLAHADLPLADADRATYLQILRDDAGRHGRRRLVVVFPERARTEIERTLATG